MYAKYEYKICSIPTYLACLQYFFNGPSPASFSIIFGLFPTSINTILQQISVKNVHPVYGTGIRTHDLNNVSLLP